jgi:hypothetical protein
MTITACYLLLPLPDALPAALPLPEALPPVVPPPLLPPNELLGEPPAAGASLVLVPWSRLP